jgi:hypothetical protein
MALPNGCTMVQFCKKIIVIIKILNHFVKDKIIFIRNGIIERTFLT